MKTFINFLKDESGNSMMQYCFMSCTITCAIAGPLKLIGERLAAVFTVIANALVVN